LATANECRSSLIENAIAIHDLSNFNISKNNAELTDAAATLVESKLTGRLAGTWILEVDVNGIKTNSEYFFGLNAGSLRMKNIISQSSIKIENDIFFTFSYQIPSKNELIINYKTITQKITSTDLNNGDVFENSFGPVPWDEYLTAYPNNSPSMTPNNQKVTYSVDNVSNELLISTSETSYILYRKS
jgi:hypothetical protein